ncbi:MAG: carbohydrate ABC transporter permease [Spirochaetaceae bacterium]|nr:MAG: carbohydrate ABC transporter permease [Spirochaetaceae bacterium]
MIERFSFDKDHRARSLFVMFNYALLAVLCLIVIFPMLKVLIDSFDRSAALIDFRLFPKEFSLDAYQKILSQASLYRPFLNSLIVTSTGTVLALVISGFMAYALTRRDLPGRKIMMTLLMVTMVFRAGILPLYLVVNSLGLRNTLWAVIIAHCVETYYLVLLRNFFDTIPRSIEESAELDGATPIAIFFRIVLPLSKPGLAAIGLFYVVLYWNQFFEYIIYMDKRELYNFQVALRDIVLVSDSSALYGFDIAPEALKNAIIIVNIIPVLILYPLLQKHFVKGINLGAIKG